MSKSEEEKRALVLDIQKMLMQGEKQKRASALDAATARTTDALREAAEHADKLVRDAPLRAVVFLPEMLAVEMLVRDRAIASQAEGQTSREVRALHRVMLRVGVRVGAFTKLPDGEEISPELVPAVGHAMQIARRMVPEVAPFPMLFVPEMIVATLLTKRAVMLAKTFVEDDDYIDTHNLMDQLARQLTDAREQKRGGN